MSDPTKTSNQEKKEVFEAYLQVGRVMLHLDARTPGVRVPPNYQNEFQLRLNFSPLYPPYDLSIDAWGVRQTLSFQGRRFPVAIPWASVFGLSNINGELRLFPTFVPDEIYSEMARNQGKSGAALEKELKNRHRGDGHSPEPSFLISPEPAISRPTRTLDEAARHPAPSSPGPRMMQRSARLELVKFPEPGGDKPDEADLKADEAAEEAAGKVKGTKGAGKGRKRTSSKAADVSSSGVESVSEGAGADQDEASTSGRKGKSSGKASTGRKSPSSRKASSKKTSADSADEGAGKPKASGKGRSKKKSAQEQGAEDAPQETKPRFRLV